MTSTRHCPPACRSRFQQPVRWGTSSGVTEAAVDPGKQDPVDRVVGDDSECPAGVLLGGDPEPGQDAAFEVRPGFHARGQWRVDPAPEPATGVELGAAMPDQVHRRDRSALARADHGGAPQVVTAARSLALRVDGKLGSPWRNRPLLDRVSAEVAPQIAQVRCR